VSAGDPLARFQRWLDEARNQDEATAMVLATAGPDGRPDARMVLLKGVDGRGLRFFTNYESAKAGQLEANPYAALVLFWPALHRQVRVRGPVERLPAAQSDEYFATRPRGAQLGALASDQSRVLRSRHELERRLAALEREYEERVIPRPAHWGGYRLRPEEWEFWTGRPNRLHDRERYRLGDGGWLVERLAP